MPHPLDEPEILVSQEGWDEFWFGKAGNPEQYGRWVAWWQYMNGDRSGWDFSRMVDSYLLSHRIASAGRAGTEFGKRAGEAYRARCGLLWPSTPIGQ